MQDTPQDRAVEVLQAIVRDLVAMALRSLHDSGDLSLTHLRLLLAVRDAPGSSCADLARQLHISASSVTRQADLLVHHGHLRRRAGDANRSVVVLELTDSGEQQVDHVLRRREEVFRQAVGVVDSDLLEAATQGLAQISTDLTQLGWGAGARASTAHG